MTKRYKKRVVKHSKGEILCGQVLRSLANGGVTPQFPLGPYFFDYMCVHNNIGYLIEWDGIQHFQYVQFIHRKEANFQTRLKGDVNKTALALLNGYTIIRLDYHQDTEVSLRAHLQAAFNISGRIYVSSPELYAAMLATEVKPAIEKAALAAERPRLIILGE